MYLKGSKIKYINLITDYIIQQELTDFEIYCIYGIESIECLNHLSVEELECFCIDNNLIKNNVKIKKISR